MRSHQYYYQQKLHKAIHSDFWKLEFSIWLQSLAWSMLALFVPILMLRYGYPLQAVIIYELVFYGIDIPLNFIARKAVLIWGARVTTIIGIICACIYAASFHYLSFGGYLILLGLAIVRAIYDAFYWVGHFYLFIESSGKPQMAGHNTGIVNSVRIVGGILGPALGASILVLTGQNMLFGIGALIFATSLIPLFMLRHTHNKPEHVIPLKDFLCEPRERRDYLSFGLYCVSATAEDPIWPLFIYVALGTVNSVASLAVVVSFSAAILSYVTGAITRKNSIALITVGSFCTALIWILRLFIPNITVYYGSVLAIGFFATLVSVPIESDIVERGRIKDALWASTLRNASSMTFPFLLFVILTPLISIFKVSFVAAALSLLVLMFITRWIGVTTKRT